jgi:hypothetical protein
MELISREICILFAIIIHSYGALIPRNKKFVFDEKVYECDEKSVKKVFDHDLDIIAESEYEMYLNGSLTFLVDIKAPWRIEAVGMKLELGDWHKKLEKSVQDFCFTKNNPTDIFYPMFGKFKNCPLTKGVRNLSFSQ